jgi:hypothetical protein
MRFSRAVIYFPPMNYNRRSTRPDGLFYREQRKIRGSARARAMAVGPVGIAAAVVVLAALAFWLFRG